MDLADLYKKHDENIEAFNALREKTWADMKKRHKEIIAAFGTKENMPKSYIKKIDEEISNYHEEWSMDGGKKYNDLIDQHYKQIEKITGKIPANDSEPKIDKSLTDRERKKQEFIIAQKSIRAKGQQQKPKR